MSRMSQILFMERPQLVAALPRAAEAGWSAAQEAVAALPGNEVLLPGLRGLVVVRADCPCGAALVPTRNAPPLDWAGPTQAKRRWPVSLGRGYLYAGWLELTTCK